MVVALVLSLSIPVWATAPPQATRTLTNADIIDMSKAGLADDIIVAEIRKAKTRAFDLSVRGLIALRTAKVSDAVIRYMQGSEEVAGPSDVPTVVDGAASSSAGVAIPAGTAVKVRLIRDLTSEAAKLGDAVELTVVEDVFINSQVAIRRGDRVIGKVTSATRQLMSRGGRLELAIEQVIVNGTAIPLSGGYAAQGKRSLIRADEAVIAQDIVIDVTIASD